MPGPCSVPKGGKDAHLVNRSPVDGYNYRTGKTDQKRFGKSIRWDDPSNRRRHIEEMRDDA